MRWKILNKVPAKIEKNLAKYNEVIIQLLYNRGIQNEGGAKLYFGAQEAEFHDAHLLNNIEQAASRVIDAIKNNQKICICGDYDVDGICSTSILFDFLYRKLGADVVPHIPNRFTDGYGLNEDSLQGILDKGANLIITVDCGIKDKELVEQFTKIGLEFVITDHHTIPEDDKRVQIIPNKAVAVVHPKLTGSKYPFTDICGTAVAWKLLEVVAEKAVEEEMLSESFSAEEYLDLVALATVCDLMPLRDENRLFVTKGIEQMKNTTNKGLATLIDSLEIPRKELKSYHMGFVIGPRLNASGRIEHALDGVRLFTTNDTDSINQLIQKLNDLNSYRQQLTRQIVIEAEEMITAEELEHRLLFLVGDEWPDGVVGLVASKIVEKYSRPVLIASKEKGIVKGSARSIPGFNVTEAIAAFADNLQRFGGHSQAAGFTFEHTHYQEFKSGLQNYANELLTDEDLIPEIEVEMELQSNQINFELLEKIFKMEPFGYGNKTPVFLFRNVEVLNAKLVGKEKAHLSLNINIDGLEIRCIGFNKKELFNIASQNDRIDVIGTLDLNHWNGSKYIQIKLKDIKPHDSSKESY